MPPSPPPKDEATRLLTPLSRCQDRYGYVFECNAWDSWVRWLVLGLVVVSFLFLFCCISCISARRRRKLGQSPMYGTGWAANNRFTPGNQHQQYPPQNPGNSYYAYQQPAPPYEANAPAGQPAYHGEQVSGIELAAPAPSYSGYQPPPGPPPQKY
jgi:hypothetical protein